MGVVAAHENAVHVDKNDRESLCDLSKTSSKDSGATVNTICNLFLNKAHLYVFGSSFLWGSGSNQIGCKHWSSRNFCLCVISVRSSHKLLWLSHPIARPFSVDSMLYKNHRKRRNALCMKLNSLICLS